MSSRPSDSRATLRPSRALLHPLWLGSLIVLVLNDHVLKGASILPAAVTGKLSDFAGLVVAPVLLATVLGARTVRGLALAHLAVGSGFAAIQLSALAAAQWSAAMAAVGFPWLITRDVTDLVALPALVLGFVVLRGSMRRPVTNPARRSAELLAAGTGLVCCAATSPAPTEPSRPDLWTDVYVHNATDEALVVRVRPLASHVVLDCSAVAEDPGRLLTAPLFGQSQSFRLDADQNFGLRINDSWESGLGDDDGSDDGFADGCYAYLLDVDGLPPAVVLWQEGSVPLHEVAGEGYQDDPRGGIDLVGSDDPDRLGTYEELGDEVVFLVPPAAPPVAGACAPQSDGARLEWSEPVPAGTWELLAIDRGADGCFALDLGVRDIDGELADESRWYLCTPQSDLALEPGRLVRVTNLPGTSLDDGGVAITTADEPAEGLPLVEIWAFRGEVFPSFHGLSVAAVPEFDCGYVVGERCGTVTRGTSVTAGGGSFPVVELSPGASQVLDDDLGSMTIAVAHAEERAALDPVCAEGPDALGIDLEVVALYVEPTPG